MIHYHGTPITDDKSCLSAVKAGHAFISYAHPSQLPLCRNVCQSYALDNGAFSAWRSGKPITDWTGFYDWAGAEKNVPNCDWAVIPDVIDGSEQDNDSVLSEWPHGKFFGVPVYHLHESIDRLVRLAVDYPRIALGSSGQYHTPGMEIWWERIDEMFTAICDDDGLPICKVHGLRMLNPDIFTKLPFASADSTNIARSIGMDHAWKGTYQPASKYVRAFIMRDRIESFNAAPRYTKTEKKQQLGLF